MYLEKAGKINLEDLQTSLMNMKIDEALGKHNYRIWHASDGRWKTYIDDSTCARGKKIIAKASKEKLKYTLFEIYKKMMILKQSTMNGLIMLSIVKTS